MNDDSQWKSFFKDNEFLAQIDRDVRYQATFTLFFSSSSEACTSLSLTSTVCWDCRRTLPDMAFFQKAVDCHNDHSSSDKNLGAVLTYRLHKKTPAQIAENPRAQPPMDKEYHWNVVERILFIYTKLNPGVGYVQGMNDIVGPLYFVFANDSVPEWRSEWLSFSFFAPVSQDERIMQMRMTFLLSPQDTPRQTAFSALCRSCRRSGTAL